MTLQFLQGKPLFKGGVPAMHPDCCCGGPCVHCLNNISGATITVAGVAAWPPGDPDCGCGPANGSFFVPWNASDPLTSCHAVEVFPYPLAGDGDCDPIFDVLLTVGYTVSCSAGFILLQGFVDISTGFFQISFTGGDCLTPEPCPGGACAGLSCTDLSPSGSGCDLSGASMQITLN